MLTSIIILSITCLVLGTFALGATIAAMCSHLDARDNEREYKRRLRTEGRLLKLSADQIYKYKGLWELHKKKSTDLRIQLHAVSKKPAPRNGNRKIKKD
jgi:hypothetical protein